MKIGVLIDELIPGGFQKVAIMEVKYLKKMGHEASLVVLHRSKQDGYEDLLKENKIDVIYLSDRLPFYAKINFHFPFFAFFSFFHVFYPLFIHRYIKENEFDIFLTHGTYTAFSSISIFKKLKIPYICFMHDSVSYILPQKYGEKFIGKILFVLMPLARMLDRMIIDNAKSVVAFPDMIKEMKKVDSKYDEYHEIFNGCEVIDRSEIIKEKKNYAMAATKWDQGKNLDFLLELWEKMDNKFPLKIVGRFVPAELKDEYLEKINEKKLSGIVEIVGGVSESELSNYYKNAIFLVHPCREAFGMTILEAAANGCPSIFTSNSGVADLFPGSMKNGFPEENNSDDYLQKIKKIMDLSTDEYGKLMNDYYDVANKNSWINHCEKLVSLMKK